MAQQYYSFCLPKEKSNPMTDLRIRWHLKTLYTRRDSERLSVTGIWGKYLLLP